MIQHFREVNRFERIALAREQALDVHQATRIVRDDVIRLGFRGGGAFHFAHRGGNHRELRGKRAAEAAAGFRLAHLDEFEAVHFAEQRARRFFDAKFAQAVAAVVERDLVRKLCAEVGDAEFADEEIGEFPGARGDLFCERGLRRVLEKLRVKNFQHRAARAGADDDGLGVRELRQDFGGDGARLVPIAGVERRLAAAGDLLGENNRVAEPFQNLDHADARARKQRVHEAGDK